MAVTSRDMHRSYRVAAPQLGMPHMNTFAYAATAALALVALYVLLSSAVAWGRTALDDIRYGRPRTFHLSAVVGNAEEKGTKTHFIAMNMDRQVLVLELPGGDATKTRVLTGPYLFGANEDLTPVTLRMEDVNHDQKPDLVVRVKEEEIVYLKRDAGFSLMTADERPQTSETP